MRNPFKKPKPTGLGRVIEIRKPYYGTIADVEGEERDDEQAETARRLADEGYYVNGRFATHPTNPMLDRWL